MLTGLHVHLRQDEPETPARTRHGGDAERYLEVPPTRGRGAGVAVHVYASARPSTSGNTHSGANWPATTSTPYCEFVRDETSLALGIEGGLRTGRRGPNGGAARGARVGLRDRLDPLPPRRGHRHARGLGHLALGRSDKVWKRYFETLGEAARSGMFDILAHPDLVKVWGSAAPVPDRDPRLLLRARDGGDRGIGRRDRGVDRRAAQAGRGDLPGRAFLEMCLEVGRPSRCRPMPTLRTTSRTATRMRSSTSSRPASARSRCSTAACDGSSRWDEHALPDRLRLAPLRAGPAARARGVEVPSARGLAGHSDADALTHALIDALLGCGRAGRHRAALPGHRRALEGRDSLTHGRRSPCSSRSTASRCSRGTQRGVRVRSSGRSATRCGGRGVDHRVRARGERQVHEPTSDGWIGRGEGVAAMAVATVERGVVRIFDTLTQRQGARAGRRQGAYLRLRPTVYAPIHVGNARPFVVFSLLKPLPVGGSTSHVRLEHHRRETTDLRAAGDGSSSDWRVRYGPVCRRHRSARLGRPDLRAEGDRDDWPIVALIQDLIDSGHAYASQATSIPRAFVRRLRQALESARSTR